MNRRHLLATLGAAAGPGCLRLTGSDTATPGGTPPGEGPSTAGPSTATAGDGATATATDEDTATGDGELTYPTGLTEDGVNTFLADRHVNALADTTFRAVWQETNVTRSTTTYHRASRVGDASALVEWRDGSDITMYSTREGNWWRQPTGAGYTYGRNRGTFEFRRRAHGDGLRAFIGAGEWNPPEPDPSTDTFVITADAGSATQALVREFEVADLRSFAAQGRVTEAGVVTELVVEFSFVPQQDQDRLVEFDVRHEVTDLGAVTVSEPGWLGTARERTPQVEVGLTDDRQFVVVEHAGGNAMLPDTSITLYDVEAGGNAGGGSLAEAIDAGTTMYVWLEGDRLYYETGGTPADANPATLDGQYAFWMHRSGAEYFGVRKLA